MWASRPGKGLAGAAEAAPGKDLAGGTRFFVFLALVLLWLSWASVLPWFTSPVLLGVAAGAAPTVRAQVKGYKDAPLLLYTNRSPQAWATHKRDTLLGQAQNGARAGWADFTTVTLRPLRFPTTRVECATWGGVRDVGGMRGAVLAHTRHVVVNGKGGSPRLPHKKE